MPNPARNETYRAYLGSTQWKALRVEVLERDKNACVKCASPYFLQVHHLTYDRIFAEDVDDLVTLCKPCHELQHPKKKRKKPKRGKRRGMYSKRGARALRPSTQVVKKKKNQHLIDLNDELHRKQQERKRRLAEIRA